MRFKTFISTTKAQAKSGMNKMSTTVKLHSKRSGLSDELSGMYDTLGKITYAEAIGEATCAEEDKNNIISTITALKAELTSVEEELRRINGKKLCPQCNAELQKDTAFCPFCGTRTAFNSAECHEDTE